MPDVLVLNGPNLNLLGQREPSVYGRTTLAEIEQRVRALLEQGGKSVEFFQTNAEHELIDKIQQAGSRNVGYIIVNAGALTHTSIGLRDALKGGGVPFIEVHISNVYARETFRRQSYLSDIAAGVIVGLGPYGYELAAQAALEQLKSTTRAQ